MFNVTPLHALVDSRASCSFIDEQLKLCTPLYVIGAYLFLEMPNSETIVSTRIALDVLESIRKIPFRSNLIFVPLMEGFDTMLGKDWLDIVNTFIDWRNNKMYI